MELRNPIPVRWVDSRVEWRLETTRYNNIIMVWSLLWNMYWSTGVQNLLVVERGMHMSYVICHTMYEHTIVSPGRSACSRSSEDVPSSNMHGAALAPLSRWVHFSLYWVLDCRPRTLHLLCQYVYYDSALSNSTRAVSNRKSGVLCHRVERRRPPLWSYPMQMIFMPRATASTEEHRVELIIQYK